MEKGAEAGTIESRDEKNEENTNENHDDGCNRNRRSYFGKCFAK